MTHSPSSTVADRPPAMYRSATTAIVVSSTSMKVGTTTAVAITRGLPPRGMLRVQGPRPSFFGARRAPRRTRCRRLRHRGLQKLPGIGPGRRFLDIDVGNDRSADEQRGLVRVVSLKLDPDRQSLHHLDVVARGILRRQQRERRSGPHGKAGDPAIEYPSAAVHVDIQIDRLADAQIA